MGIGGGAKQQVRDYMMSVHVGVSSTLDAVTGLKVDNKVAWEGEVTANDVVTIQRPDLFGGVKEQGGLRGLAYMLMGKGDQVLPAPLISRLGRTVGNCPGFRGLTSIFFVGLAGALPDTLIAGGKKSGGSSMGSGYGNGFWWSSNNPQVASQLDVQGRRCPTGLSSNLARVPSQSDTGYTAAIGTTIATTADHLASAINGTSQYFTAHVNDSDVIITSKRSDSTWDTDGSGGVIGSTTYFTISAFSGPSATLHFNLLPETGLSFTVGPETYSFVMGGDDANPAHILYDIFTNSDWGMGYTADLIDGDSFIYASEILYAETLGLSLEWTTQMKIEDFVNEVLNHIQGLIYVSRSTGLLTLKLIRADYDETTLPTYTVDNALMSNYQQRGLDETTNEIVVTWTNPLNEESESVYAQELGNIAAQGGVVSDSRNYYGVRNATLAAALARREVTSASALLRSMDMEVNRTAWNAEPGDVVIVDWPENNISNAVMRVGQVNYGKIDDPSIKISLLEDIFSLAKPNVVVGAATSAAVDPSSAPADLPAVQVTTIPMFFAMSGLLQANKVSLTYPEVLAAILPSTSDGGVFDCEVWVESGTEWSLTGTKSIVESGTLTTALVAEATSSIPCAIFATTDKAPIAGSMVMIGTDDVHQEWCQVVSNDGTTIALTRGCLDTIPQAWAIGTRVWSILPGMNLVDDVNVWSAGTSPQYKITPRTAQGFLPITSATAHSTTLTARPHLPLRPANVKVNGVAFGSVDVSGTSNIAITWATRNRLMEDGQVHGWTDASVTPEYQQETVVTAVDNATGTTVYEQGGLWTDTSLTLPKSDFARYSSVTLKVWSRRDGYASLQAASFQITGLANNPSSPVPPAPPAVADAPSPIASPGSSAFTVTGSAITSTGGTSLPTIKVTGSSDNGEAMTMLIRFRVHGSSDPWSYWPPAYLNGSQSTTVNIVGVAASTQYDVQIAYQAVNSDVTGWGIIPSNWTTPTGTPVTTGASISTALLEVDNGSGTVATNVHKITITGLGATTTSPATGEVAIALSAAAGGALIAANNLSDVADVPTSRNNLGLSAAATMTVDTDGTLGANSDTRLSSQKAVKTYVDGRITSALKYQSAIDCSGSPNYPAATKGYCYLVSVAGRIGGGSGVQVDVGDLIVADADNAGGTQASVGASWFVLEHNLVGALLSANNLSDLTDLAAARTHLGLGSVATKTLDTDGTLAANSDGNVASQKAVKTYVDHTIATATAIYAPAVLGGTTGVAPIAGPDGNFIMTRIV